VSTAAERNEQSASWFEHPSAETLAAQWEPESQLVGALAEQYRITRGAQGCLVVADTVVSPLCWRSGPPSLTLRDGAPPLGRMRPATGS
jgi:hypothetical protein